MRTGRVIPRLCFLVVVAGCQGAGADTSPVADDATPIRLAEVTEESSAMVIEAVGVLAPREEIRLSFKVAGVIARMLVTEGTRVRGGQPLAALDTREIDAQVAKARSALEKAERDHARARRLYGDSVVTLEQFEHATTALEVARSDYEATVFNQRYAFIHAPATGVILRRSAEQGELVSPGQPIVLFGNDAAGTIMRVSLPDRDAVRVQSGDAAAVVFDALPAQTFAGRVTRTASAADPSTGTYTIEVALARGPRDLNGLIGRVRLEPSARDSVKLVPIEAIHEADGSIAVVYTVAADGRTAERVPVRLGPIRGDRIVIVGGLDGVDRVVTAGSAYLTHGSRVTVVQ